VVIHFFFNIFSDCKEKEPSALANDERSRKKLWEISEKSVRLNEPLEENEKFQEDTKV